jgi:3',5'-cyclic-AMP phosphodiesterase
MPFRIAQISDTHLSDDKPFFVDNFRRIGEAIRRSRPDMVLNSGDIALDGASNPDDLAAARRLHDELGLPVRFLPGNHDLGDSQDVLSDRHPSIDADRRQRYVEQFGPDWWCFDVPGWRLLGVNAQLLGSDLVAAEEQESAIGKAMIGLGARRLALFLHKPLFDQRMNETEVGGRFVNPAPRRLLLAALKGASPALVACGHVHQYRATRPGGATHVWATSTAYVIPDRRQPRYGVKEVGYVEHCLHADGTYEGEFIRVPGVPTLDIGDFPQAYGPI